jgi:hypothetical protein
MKQFLFSAALALALFSCTGNNKQTATSDSAYELDNLLAVADQKVDETITVVGYVTHTCKHTGKKCFIIGESQEASIQVNADGEIDVFTPELIGSRLSVTGILKEQQLSQEYIDEMESEVMLLQNGGEVAAETCEAELASISDMRQWMKDHDKDYYVIYYMDGMKYEVLD